MRFADLNPVASLDWLEPLGEDRFGHADLIRFGVPPKASEDTNPAFSLTRRPAPYDLAPRMALADAGGHEGRYDKVMVQLVQLVRWLIRHLNNPSLLLWLVKQGGRPHAELSRRIAHCLDELADLEHAEKQEELDRIRANAPDAIPDTRMRTLWGLLLTGRVTLAGEDLGPLRVARAISSRWPDNLLAAGTARDADPACVAARSLFVAVRRR